MKHLFSLSRFFCASLNALKIIACGALLTGSALAASPLRVVGSDFLEAPLKPVFRKYADETGQAVNVNMHGSLPAMKDLASGQADVAVIAVPLGEAQIAKPLVSVPVAFQSVVVMVNRQNPLTEISVRQLAGIFGTGVERELTRWEDLGLTGLWTNRPIQAISVNRQEGVVQELFRSTVLNGGQFKPNLQTLDSPERVRDVLRTEAGAIAIAGRPAGDDKTKVLLVSSGKSGQGAQLAFPPTEENLLYGDYPIRLPFLIVFREENRAEVKGLVRALLSDEAAEQLGHAGFFAIPSAARKRFVLELDIRN